MGCWSTDIIGGDLSNHFSAVWKQEFGDASVSSSDIIELIHDVEEDTGGIDSEVIYQAAGYMTITTGSEMSSALKEMIITAIDNDQLAAWDNKEERLEKLNELRSAIESYDGTPVIYSKQTSLADRIATL